MAGTGSHPTPATLAYVPCRRRNEVLVGGPPDPATLERPWLASYPPGVPPIYRLPEVTVTRFLEDAARDFPERPAIAAGRERIDHVTLRVRADTVATALSRRGVTTGDRVLIGLPNDAALPIVLLAVWRLGAVAVPVDPRAQPDRVVAIARDARVAVAIGTGTVLHHLGEHAASPPLTVQVTGDEWPTGGRLARWVPRARARDLRPRRRTADAERVVTLAELLPEGEVRELPPAATPDHVALLAYRPRSHRLRGVVLTHRNLVASAFQARLWVPDVQAGREVLVVPDGVFETPPLALGWLAGLLSAATVVLLDDPDPGTLARAVEREKATLLLAVPRRLTALASDGDAGRRDLTSLRVVLAQGAPLDATVAATLEGRTAGARVRELFGLAEAGGLTHGQPVYGRTTTGTAGLPVTSTVAAVVDLEDLGALLPPGVPGRLLVHGPQVALGYLGHEDASAERFVHGWLVTDDLAVVDEEGIFTHLGRRDAVVDRDGWLVSLRAVETTLEDHPAVRRAGVVGTEDGGVLVAAVVARRRGRPSPDDLLGHCREHLDPRSVPDRVVLVDRLPEDAVGELDRDALRRDLVAR
jgi:long-chain acyl-CoA synthetase